MPRFQAVSNSANDNGNLQSASYTYSGPDYSAPVTVNQTYTYDAANELTNVVEAGHWGRGFDYDVYGNMWVDSNASRTYGIAVPGTAPSAARNFNTNNQISPWLTYDAAGNQTTVNGNTTIGDAALYDAENRMVQTTQSASLGGYVEPFVYDGEDRRVEKTIPVSGSPATVVYVYDAMGLLAAEYSTLSTYGSPCTTPCYLTHDYLGSLRMVTDQASNLIARQDYLPYGEAVPASQFGRSSLFGGISYIPTLFTGQLRDSEVTLDYFGARYYGSVQGRFASPDKPLIGQSDGEPQSWNLYSYVGNNPLRYTDPTGQSYYVCLSDGNGGVSCQTYSDKEYAALYGMQNGQQGVTLPGQFQSGNINCGGSICGSSFFYSDNEASDEMFQIGLGVGVGKFLSAVVSRAVGAIGAIFSRAATSTASSTVYLSSDALSGRIFTGFSTAQEQMLQKALSVLEAAGTNTGRLKEVIRLADAPPAYLGVAVDSQTAALGDGAFSSEATLIDTIEHELVHLDQHAEGCSTTCRRKRQLS